MFAKIDMWLMKGYSKARNFFQNEEGALTTMEVVILIGIAVVIAGLFRKQISGLLTTMFGEIEKGAVDAITPT